MAAKAAYGGGGGGGGGGGRQKGRWDGRKHSGEGRNPSMAGMESPDKGRGGGEGIREDDRSAAVYLFSADAIKTDTSRFFTYGTL